MYRVRNLLKSDIPGVIHLCAQVYPGSPTWSEKQLLSHISVFPKGQLVVVDEGDRIVGYAASLIILWDDYDMQASWRDFTDHGMFTNHDPEHGRTLYGAEVMVAPDLQGKGIGKLLYRAREELVRELGLLRIRAGARLRGYHKYADALTPEEYVTEVVSGHLKDPTLSFQIRQGFKVLGIAREYLRHDPESQGMAAVIEWLNPDVAKPEDYFPRLRSKFYR